MRKALLALGILVLIPALCFGVIWFSFIYQGSPREAERQVEALGHTMEQFLTDHRDALEQLRSAAETGAELPGGPARKLLNAPLEEAGIHQVFSLDGQIIITLDNSMYAGRIYTSACLGSGAPPLPEGTAEEGEQTFRTFDRYHRMELVSAGWYAEYWSYPRG